MDAWLERCEVPADDRAAIRASGLGRLLVYRDLVRSNLREALEAAMPRTIARLGVLFDEYFDRWLAAVGPRTHYLRDVTEELLAFVEPLWREDPRVPAWAIDLGRHEAVWVRVAAKAARSDHAEPEALALDRPLRFIEAVSLVRYAHAVHELVDDVADRTAPASRPTALFVYRSLAHEVRFLELSPLAHAILARLLDRTPLGEAVRAACAEQGVPLEESVIAGTSELLHDLSERGALLGASPEGCENGG
ncbi:MAG: putative DNA-binding domain-containing protein [Polyangiaceae bacterium]